MENAAIITNGIENDIDREQARRAYCNTSFSPEKRGDRVVESYVLTLKELAAFIEKNAQDDKQKAVMQDVFDGLREKYKAKTLASLAAQSRCISSMITGGSNFPVRRAEKANEAERKRSDEWLDFHNSLEKYALKSLQAVYTAQEVQLSEIDQLKADISKAEKNQQTMKDCNAAIRKGDYDKVREWLGDSAAAILEPDFAGRKGFASFQLTNNLANIKRMKERLTFLESKAERAVTQGEKVQEFNGLKVVLNYTEDRLQLLFDEKPNEEVRKILKSNGFVWSGKFSAWQRKLTGNATYALKHLLRDSQPMQIYRNATPA